MRKPLTFAAGILCCVIISSCSAKEKVIGLQQNIHHDDFDYSVLSVEKAEQIESLRAHGVFYVVAFQVENHAKRVDHRWGNDIAYLIDDTGTKHYSDATAQVELNRAKPFGYKQAYDTPAGVTETTTLVFDLPKDTKQPYLRVTGFLLMGDVFDGNQFKKTRVKLF
jgi:hypothetical protein